MPTAFMEFLQVPTNILDFKVPPELDDMFSCDDLVQGINGVAESIYDTRRYLLSRYFASPSNLLSVS